MATSFFAGLFMSPDRHDYLKRLPREYYQGDAYVHWSMAIDQRKTGWLTPVFYYRFRELLTHALFRYGLICPVYCCMPDHVHLLWMGLWDGSDQLNAAKFFRRQINVSLNKIGFVLQGQAYDNVLSEEERERGAFEAVCEYIARNPERRHLVAPDEFAKYKFTNCLVPGAPELTFFQPMFWDSFWRIHSASKRNGLMRLVTKKK